jgi:hypothetical protein
VDTPNDAFSTWIQEIATSVQAQELRQVIRDIQIKQLFETVGKLRQ